MNHWGGYEAIVRYRLFANILRLSLDKNILQFDDFWKSEKFVIEKIENCKNDKIKEKLSLLRKPSLKDLPKSNKKEYKKFRYVNPKFISKDKIMKLSSANKKFKLKLEKAREKNKKGINLPKIL